MFRLATLVLLLFALVAPQTAIAQDDWQGMDLEDYCGEQRLVLLRYSPFGFRCMTDEGVILYSHIDFVEVCAMQYDGDRPYPLLHSAYHPNAWTCESTLTTEYEFDQAAPPTMGGWLDLNMMCAYFPFFLEGSIYTVTDPNDKHGHACVAPDGKIQNIEMQNACLWMYPYIMTHPVSGGESPAEWSCELVDG